MATDKNGVAFEVGQRVRVEALSPSPWSSHEPGAYSGEVTAVHEDGPYVTLGDGSVILPFAEECEVQSIARGGSNASSGATITGDTTAMPIALAKGGHNASD